MFKGIHDQVLSEEYRLRYVQKSTCSGMLRGVHAQVCFEEYMLRYV
jgi:hypothetical protein